jgi:hypothetical protein
LTCKDKEILWRGRAQPSLEEVSRLDGQPSSLPENPARRRSSAESGSPRRVHPVADETPNLFKTYLQSDDRFSDPISFYIIETWITPFRH